MDDGDLIVILQMSTEAVGARKQVVPVPCCEDRPSRVYGCSLRFSKGSRSVRQKVGTENVSTLWWG